MLEPITPPAPITPPVPPGPPVADPPVPVGPHAGETPAETIARLEFEVKSARQEAGKARIAAKQTIADEARTELAKQVGQALGLVPGDIPPDPTKLIEDVAAANALARQSAVELAVFRAADAAGGDPVALLDSRTFLEAAAQIDPTDTAALEASITAAVTGNPRLGKTATPGMKPNPAQGRGNTPPLGLDAQIAAAQERGDVRESVRLKSASLATPPK